MKLRMIGLAVVAVAWAGPAWCDGVASTAAQVRAAPTAMMPEKVYRLFKGVVEGYQFENEELRKRNLAALEGLRVQQWPDFDKLKLVRIHSSPDGKDAGLAWCISRTDAELVVMMPDMRAGRVDLHKVGKVEEADFGRAVDALLRYLNSGRQADWQPLEFSFIGGADGEGAVSYYGGANTLSQAVAAAWLGMDDRAKALLEAQLRQPNQGLLVEMDQRTWPSYGKGIEMLESGTARSEVLAHWEKVLNTYHGSGYEGQIREMIGLLKVQVRDDEALARVGGVKVDPATLSEEERIRFFAARLGDVHGEQNSNPGECHVIYGGDGTSFSDALVKIGRPALGTLIGLLEDRRLTRSVGFLRMWDEHPWVLRYQDVAVKCIEAIVDIRFYNRSHSGAYLSNEDAEIRERVIADIRTWYKAHGGESAVKGQMARLESGSIFDRIETLHKVEKLDFKAVDGISILKQWADRVRGKESGRRELPAIAMALAERGDFSMRTEIRKLAQVASENEDVGSLMYVTRYGEVEDFRILIELHRRLSAGGQTGRDHWMIHTIVSELKETENPAAVPVLVAYLDQRELIGLRGTPTGGVNFSLADECMEKLTDLTGRNAGYDADATPALRFAAIDEWISWWKKEGETEFVKAHPQAGLVIGTGPATRP